MLIFAEGQCKFIKKKVYSEALCKFRQNGNACLHRSTLTKFMSLCKIMMKNIFKIKMQNLQYIDENSRKITVLCIPVVLLYLLTHLRISVIRISFAPSISICLLSMIHVCLILSTSRLCFIYVCTDWAGKLEPSSS